MGTRFEINKVFDAQLSALGFGDYFTVMSHKGDDYAAQSKSSSTIRVVCGGSIFYLKRYWYSKPILKYCFRPSRAKTEQKNLKFLCSLGIPVPKLVLWGEHRSYGFLRSCFIITEAVPQALNLMEFCAGREFIASKGRIRREAIGKLAGYLKEMHGKGYVDYDMFFRNVLIYPLKAGTAEGYEFAFIDSPKGRKVSTAFGLNRGRIYDLSSLEKNARDFLSVKNRIRFLRDYFGVSKLETKHRLFARKVDEAAKALVAKSRLHLERKEKRRLLA